MSQCTTQAPTSDRPAVSSRGTSLDDPDIYFPVGGTGTHSGASVVDEAASAFGNLISFDAWPAGNNSS
ncbi:unnamed protein product, partial [Amoebophrya sp. A25]|eukprot:GSA25T00009175001.1